MPIDQPPTTSLGQCTASITRESPVAPARLMAKASAGPRQRPRASSTSAIAKAAAFAL